MKELGRETKTRMKEFLPHDVIEYHILVRLVAKTLLKLKSISKQWKSTIQSSSFQKRQLMHHQNQSRRDPYVLVVSEKYGSFLKSDLEEVMGTVVEGSGSSSSSVSFHMTDESYNVCNTSCDGLICLYDFDEKPIIVVNPVTRWHRTLPKCNYQLLVPAKKGERDTYPTTGFGKDKISGTYKPVWLYNSAELGLNNNATTCEVFDFATNAWRYVVPASPHLILDTRPVYFDGSLHWFTDSSQEGETMVLSMDLHTETFQVIAKAPFKESDENDIVMCILDNSLCVSDAKLANQVQDIWSLDSDHKTWKKIYSIDLNITTSYFRMTTNEFACKPLAVLDKDKLLFYDFIHWDPLVIHDPNINSYDVAYYSLLSSVAVCYFPSLISIL